MAPQIDHTIALKIGRQQPERPDLVDRLGQLEQFRQQRQLHEQQTQLNEQRLRAGERAETDELAKRDMLSRIDGVLKRGLGFKETVEGIRQIHPEYADNFVRKFRENFDLNMKPIAGMFASALASKNPEVRSRIVQNALRFAEVSGRPEMVEMLKGVTTDDADLQSIVSFAREAEQIMDEALEREKLNRPPELTAEERNFQSFYGPWLESNGLTRSARNEVNARVAFRKLGHQPGFQEAEARLTEEAYAETIGKPFDQFTARDRLEARKWRERMTPRDKTEFDKRLDLLRSDPETYDRLYGRGNDSGLTPAQGAQIIQRIFSSPAIQYSRDENEIREYYEQQRRILGGVGVEIPPYDQARPQSEMENPGGDGSQTDRGTITGGIGAMLNPPSAPPTPPPPPGRTGEYSVGQRIKGDDGKTYQITGFWPDGEPMLYEVKR